MTKLYKIKDVTDKVSDAVLYGDVANKLEGDNTSRFAILKNLSDSRNDTPPTERMEIENSDGSELFNTNELTLSCWIYLTGESEGSCGVITNGDDSNRCGLLINANSETGNDEASGIVGYTWENTLEQNSDGEDVWSVEDNPFGEITIPKKKWTHVAIMIYPSGRSRLFIDNVYRASFDEGVVRDKVSFSKLELGRFNGYADGLMCFSTTLDYGNVDIDQAATSEFSYLYYTSRTNPRSPIVETPIIPPKPTADNIPFYYMQSDEYNEAAALYEENTTKKIESGMFKKDVLESQTQEDLMLQKHSIEGGPNDKTRVYADNKFMTFTGELRKL
jgi:hypothetical protein